MNFYSINIKPVYLRTNDQQSGNIIDNLLPFILTWHMRKNITNYLLAKEGISDSITYATIKVTATAPCYSKNQIPTYTIDWSLTYILNPNTNIIINIQKKHSKNMWSQDELAKVETSYRQHLWEKQIIIHDGKLILQKLIFKIFCFISLIIVPTSLCRKYSAVTMTVPQVVIWENIKLYFVSVYGFGPDLRKDIKNGLKDAITV